MGVVLVVDGAGIGLAAAGAEAEDAGLVHPVADVGANGAVRRVRQVEIVPVVGIGFIDARIGPSRSESLEFFGVFVCVGIVIDVLIIHSSISAGLFVSIK